MGRVGVECLRNDWRGIVSEPSSWRMGEGTMPDIMPLLGGWVGVMLRA